MVYINLVVTASLFFEDARVIITTQTTQWLSTKKVMFCSFT